MRKIGLIICILLLGLFVRSEARQARLTGVKVVLDAGHGGFDNGAIEYGYKEDDLNLKIVLKLKKVLEREGAKVYLTRDGDYDMTKRNHHYSKQDDMYLRVKKIDSYNANYLISIHQNASTNKSAWGSQVFYYYNSSKAKTLAGNIDKSLKEISNSNKPISGSGFRVLRATKTLGVLIECGFISNYNECGQLRNNSYQNKLCEAICDGLVRYHKNVINKQKKKIEKVLE